MRIQKFIFAPEHLAPPEVIERLSTVFAEELQLFAQWEPLSPVFSVEEAPTRAQAGSWAYRLEASLRDEDFETLMPGFPARDAQTIFVGTALEHGWDVVPRQDEIAYLHGQLEAGELRSVFRFYGNIRHYTTRSQLMPNLVRCKRIVVFSRELIPLLQEAFTIFPQRCYVVSDVLRRVAGHVDDVETLARLNGIVLHELEDYIHLLVKIAGNTVTLSSGAYRLDPISWPPTVESVG